MTIEERIIAAIKKTGTTILPGHFGVLYEGGRWQSIGDCCCPLGAVLLAENPHLGAPSRSLAASKSLNVTKTWIIDFCQAVDDGKRDYGSPGDRAASAVCAWFLGEAMRALHQRSAISPKIFNENQ